MPAMSLGGYVALLLFVFAMTPALIVIARRYHWSDRINLRALLMRAPLQGKMKGLLLQNVELSKRPLNQQLDTYLYSRSNYGLVVDMIQAALSLVSCGLVVYSSTFPFTEADPEWAIALEMALTVYFAIDYSLRFFLAQDRLAFYFSPLSLLDYVTIVPGLLSMLMADGALDANAFVVAQTLRVFRIFRVVRLLRIVALSTSSSLNRQFAMLAVTVLAMVFAAAAIFQILDSTPQRFVPFHHAVLYMTITIIGRPPIPTQTDAAKIMETITIFIGSFVIPAFIAELARLYFEQQGREVYASDATVPHVILCGDVNPSRLRAFLAQFFHKSRDPEQLSPLVVLSEQKYEGSLKTLIEQSRYAGSVKYLRGSARKPSDLKRAGAQHASTVIILCHGRDVDAGSADSEIVSACLALKNINKKVRVLTQLRRPRSREHLMCLPGWRDADRAVAISSLSMTLLGVGSLLPGLPTLLTNLVHQGNKKNARSSNPRRRKAIPRQLLGLGAAIQGQSAGMIVASSSPWWAAPVMTLLDVVERAGKVALEAMARPGVEGESEEAKAKAAATAQEMLAQLLRPMSPVEEYTSGFAQEMFAFAVTPALAGLTFATCARAAYLRYGVLLLGVRVPVGGLGSPQGGAHSHSTQEEADAAYKVQLFPADLILRQGMFLHAVAFDALDLAALLQSTGGLELAQRMALAAGGDVAAAKGPAGTKSTGMHKSNSTVALQEALGRSTKGMDTQSAWGHNKAAVKDLHVPWCFAENEEEHSLAVIQALAQAGYDWKGTPEGKAGLLPPGLVVHSCSCTAHANWSDRNRNAIAAGAYSMMQSQLAAGHAHAHHHGHGGAGGVSALSSPLPSAVPTMSSPVAGGVGRGVTGPGVAGAGSGSGLGGQGGTGSSPGGPPGSPPAGVPYTRQGSGHFAVLKASGAGAASPLPSGGGGGAAAMPLPSGASTGASAVAAGMPRSAKKPARARFNSAVMEDIFDDDADGLGPGLVTGRSPAPMDRGMGLGVGMGGSRGGSSQGRQALLPPTLSASSASSSSSLPPLHGGHGGSGVGGLPLSSRPSPSLTGRAGSGSTSAGGGGMGGGNPLVASYGFGTIAEAEAGEEEEEEEGDEEDYEGEGEEEEEGDGGWGMGAEDEEDGLSEGGPTDNEGAGGGGISRQGTHRSLTGILGPTTSLPVHASTASPDLIHRTVSRRQTSSRALLSLSRITTGVLLGGGPGGGGGGALEQEESTGLDPSVRDENRIARSRSRQITLGPGGLVSTAPLGGTGGGGALPLPLPGTLTRQGSGLRARAASNSSGEGGRSARSSTPSSSLVGSAAGVAGSEGGGALQLSHAPAPVLYSRPVVNASLFSVRGILARAAANPKLLTAFFTARRHLNDLQAKARRSITLTPHRDHILVCGMSDSIGLLLRALQTPPPMPPRACAASGLASLISEQVGLFVERRAMALVTVPVGKGGVGAGGGPGGGAGKKVAATPEEKAAAAAAAIPMHLRHLPIVVLCPAGEKPTDAVMNAMHSGSSKWMSRVSFLPGSPNDLEDLLRAGVETARAAVVLSTKRPQANPDGTDNLADDTDAIVVASAIYKLNPSLHILTEVIHGPHASYLRPLGSTLQDAEEFSSIAASVKRKAEVKHKYEAKQRRMQEKQAAQKAQQAEAAARAARGESASGAALLAVSSAQAAPSSSSSSSSSSAIAAANAASLALAASMLPPSSAVYLPTGYPLSSPASASLGTGTVTPPRAVDLSNSSLLLDSPAPGGRALGPLGLGLGAGAGASAHEHPAPIHAPLLPGEDGAREEKGEQGLGGPEEGRAGGGEGDGSSDSGLLTSPPMAHSGMDALQHATRAALGLSPSESDGPLGALGGEDGGFSPTGSASEGGPGGSASSGGMGMGGMMAGGDRGQDSIGVNSSAGAMASRLARERIKMALAAGDTIGRAALPLSTRNSSRRPLAGLFAPPSPATLLAGAGEGGGAGHAITASGITPVLEDEEGGDGLEEGGGAEEERGMVAREGGVGGTGLAGGAGSSRAASAADSLDSLAVTVEDRPSAGASGGGGEEGGVGAGEREQLPPPPLFARPTRGEAGTAALLDGTDESHSSAGTDGPVERLHSPGGLAGGQEEGGEGGPGVGVGMDLSFSSGGGAGGAEGSGSSADPWAARGTIQSTAAVPGGAERASGSPGGDGLAMRGRTSSMSKSTLTEALSTVAASAAAVLTGRTPAQGHSSTAGVHGGAEPTAMSLDGGGHHHPSGLTSTGAGGSTGSHGAPGHTAGPPVLPAPQQGGPSRKGPKPAQVFAPGAGSTLAGYTMDTSVAIAAAAEAAAKVQVAERVTVGPAPKMSAPSDIFGAPAFAAGRAFSTTTLDALMCEAHFAPHIIFIIKQLVRASRKQRLQLLPVADAVAMGLLVAPVGPGSAVQSSSYHVSPPSASTSGGAQRQAVVEAAVVPAPGYSTGGAAGGGVLTGSDWDDGITAGRAQQGGKAGGKSGGGASGAAAGMVSPGRGVGDSVAVSVDARPAIDTMLVTGATAALLQAVYTATRGAAGVPNNGAVYVPEVRTYGALFETLLRGWNLLPVGLYRRVQPGSELNPPVVPDPVSHFVAAFASPAAAAAAAAVASAAKQASSAASSGPASSAQQGGGGGGAGGGAAATSAAAAQMADIYARLGGSAYAGYTGSAAFAHEKSLLSYVFTNPPPDTLLNSSDFIYVLRPSGEDDEEEM